MCIRDRAHLNHFLNFTFPKSNAITVNEVKFLKYDMLLAWGLTVNPPSVKIYRANVASSAANFVPVFNGFTFKF